MALSFPTTGLVANVTTYTYGGNTWLWDGNEWNIYSNPSPSFNSPSVAGTLTVNNLTVTGTATGVATALQIAGTGPSGVLGGVKVDGTTISINGQGVISGSNSYSLPQALPATSNGGRIGGVIPDGTTITINSLTGVISGANTYSLPPATTSTLGGVIVPAVATSGLNVDNNGNLSLATASTSQIGGVAVDGTTITISSGVISGYPGYTLPAATTSTLGGIIVPVTANSGFTNSSGTLRLATASTVQLGGVKVDGQTIVINGSGVISAQITGAIVFQGGWNATLNSPYLTNGVGTVGFEYVVTTAGTVNFGAGNISFVIGDNVIYNGTVWVRVPIGTSSGTVNNALTINSSGLGATSPASFNGGSAITISYNTVGAEPAGGSSDIETVGTITNGTWNATLIGSQYGGTGVNNSPYTITVTNASQTLNQSVASGAAPTFAGTNFSSIPNTALTNNSITFGTTAQALGSTVSGLNAVSIGVANPAAGSFTTLGATGAITHNTTTNNQSYTTTSTGVITISSGAAGSINNMSIGGTTPLSGAFTTLSATGAITHNTTTNNQSYTTTGTGVITISSGAVGSINNISIGGTTPALGTFTGITINAATNTAGITTGSTGVTSTAWTTSGINLKLQAKTFTDSSSTGGVTASYINVMGSPTFASSSSATVTDAVNLYVGAPIAGTNTTITNGSAILTNGVIKSTLATGTAPFVVASTTQIANLNASYLGGATFASPGTIGGTTAGQVNATNIVQTSGVHYYQQPTITALTATATLTIAQLLTLIITMTSTTSTVLTLPTGALTDAGILSGALVTNGAFEWYIITLSTGASTVAAAATGHTFVGNATVAANSQASFRTVKTATSTFTTYRIS